jgi:histidinol phosphatase-like PHP family hydrolase
VQIKPSPLLCELHAHTTWSDGALAPAELVDLYGRAGFDVLAITDHAQPGYHVGEAAFLVRLGTAAQALGRAA